ncbi:MAG TPA: hypothetical protein VHS31_00780 [Tepidisphaeraceae bacterium]|jgi:DNA topoisomerase-1|nr:hypothetical protein [Tepidisphaeraceae bacterium]
MKKSDEDAHGLQANRHYAKKAGLRYVNDDVQGLKRVRAGKGFKYVNAKGRVIHDPHTLNRIKALAIPPAWEEVWICPWDNGHIQAIGRDARGRKQYRYHDRWREVRDSTKYHHMIDFAHALPRIHRMTRRHLAKSGLAREKVLAALVCIMEQTFIRVGNDEYAKSNHSFGLTTMRNRHVKVAGKKIIFEFRGKSGVEHKIDLANKRIAKVVRKCQELPQQQLFEYLDEEGKQHDVKSGDVNDYLREISGAELTAKDFRTWAGTVLAARALKGAEKPSTKAANLRNIKSAIAEVAGRLGNTTAVCRKCYIHPAVITCYLDGTLKRRLSRKNGRSHADLCAEDAAVLSLLENL